MLLFALLNKPIAWLITSLVLFTFDKTSFSSQIILWGAVAAALGALWTFVKKAYKGIREAGRRISALADLAEHELNHNSGSSLKDHAKAALDEVRALNTKFEHYVMQNSKESEAMWSAIEAVAKAAPADMVRPSPVTVSVEHAKVSVPDQPVA